MSPTPSHAATPRVRRLSFQVGVLLVALACVAGLEWLDEASGPHYGFSLFYLVPVVAVAWFLGGFLAGLVAVCAAMAWFLAELTWRPMETLPAVVWNSSTRLVIFVAVGWLVARVRTSREELLAANRRLATLLGRESVLARTDPMTELPNWRAFEERLGAEIARARRNGVNLCVGYLDLDNFKRVNDIYGHGAGDGLLRRIAASLGEALRPEDALARIGGDEFAFLMNGARPEDLEEVGRRLIERVRQLGQGYPGTDVGASVGLVCGLPLRRGQDELVHLADQAMYQAKAAGKGRVRAVFLDGAPRPELPDAIPPSPPAVEDDPGRGPERSEA